MTSLIKKAYWVAVGIPLSKANKSLDKLKLQMNRSGSKVQFDEQTSNYYGVNRKEDLIRVVKP